MQAQGETQGEAHVVANTGAHRGAKHGQATGAGVATQGHPVATVGCATTSALGVGATGANVGVA